MTRKKREIQKRKRQQESRSEPALETNVDSFSGQPEEGESERIGLQKGSRVVTSTGPVSPQGKSGTATRPFQAGERAAFSRGRENLLLGLLALYVFLLGLGTFGELFEVEWILNLPLFK